MGLCATRIRPQKQNSSNAHIEQSQQGEQKTELEQNPIKNQMIKRKMRGMGDDLYRGVTIRMIKGQVNNKWVKSETLNTYYYGAWSKGEWNGRGVLYFPDKERMLIATFTAGKPVTAMVKVIESDGTLYTGPLSQKYEYEGVGTLENKKFSYRGNFLENTFHGNGSYKSESEKYEGTFIKGYKSHGVLITEKGTYKGPFKNNQPSGQGQFLWEDGGCYKGQFKQGEMDGKGKLFDADSKLVRSGRWEKGRMMLN